MGRASRTDDSDRMLIALVQFAPNIEHDGWRMNLAQLTWIERRLGGDDICAELANTLKLARQINNIFPMNDLIRDVVSDSFNCAQGVPPRSQNAIGRFKNFQELAQPNRPHGRKHVQRDASFG